MKVRELIEVLQQHNPDQLVVVDGYESGYDDPYVDRVKICKGEDESRYCSIWAEEFKEDSAFDAVVVTRYQSLSPVSNKGSDG